MVNLAKYMRKGLAETPENPILKFSAYASQIPDVVKFTIGEPDFETPDHIKMAAQKGISENHSHYAPSNGTIGLRKAASQFLAAKYGQKYDPTTEVLVTNGVSEAIFDTVLAVLNPGDVMVVPTPIFSLYMADETILNEGVEIVEIDTSSTGFKLTPAALQEILKQYGDRVRMLVMNYPTNPTGIVYSQAELDALADVIRDRPIFAVCDEIYSELCYDQPHASLEKPLHEQVILLNGVSKSWAMTGYRIGIVCAPQEILAQIAKVHQTIATTEATPMQDAAEEAFKNGLDDARLMKTEFQKRRDVLYTGLNKLGFECAKPQGAFYLFAKIPAGLEQDDRQLIYDLVDQAHVAVTSGSCFAKGGAGYLRFSYAVGMDQIQVGLKRLTKFVQENQN